MNPGLENEPFDAQIEKLLADGFSGSHMFPPYLRQIGYDAHLVIANCPGAQLQWAREHAVTELTPQNWLYEIPRRQVEFFRPDVLYLSHPLDGFDTRFLDLLSWRPSMVMGWRAASIPAGTDWSRFDVMLSHLQVCRAKALKHGARAAVEFHPGFPSFISAAIKEEPISWDVVFTGQWTPEHKRRNEFLLEVAHASKDSDHPFSFGLFMRNAGVEDLPLGIRELCQEPKWGMAMYRALASGRISINAEIDLANGEAGNMRLFEATGSGTFLLTEEHSNIGKYFEPGTDIETFRTASELIEKTRWFLDKESERKKIAQSGQARCLNDYSMEKRAIELDRIIRSHCAKKGLKNKASLNGSNIMEDYVLEGDLGHILKTLQGQLNQFPRRSPGRLKLEGKSFRYADLHSFYYEALQIFSQNLYDVELTSPRPLIVDCGAHIGLATLRFASMHPNSVIHTFEADPDIGEMLEDNVRSFGLHNVSVQKKAVWIHEDGVKFSQSCDDSGHIDGRGETRVPSFRLRDFLVENEVDLIKLDIEGAEFQVIKDCEDALARVRNLIIEVHRFANSEDQLGELLTILKRRGFHYMLGDLHAADWIPCETNPPFHACSTKNFIITVFAWRGESAVVKVEQEFPRVETSEGKLKRAVELLNSQHNEDALSIFDDVRGEQPQWGLVEYARAIAVARIGRTKDASDILTSLIKVEPEFRKAKMLLVELNNESLNRR